MREVISGWCGHRRKGKVWALALTVFLIAACGGSGGGGAGGTGSSSSLSSSSSSSSSSSQSSSTNGEAPVRADVGLAERELNTSCVAPNRPTSDLGSYEFQAVTMPSGMDNPMYLTQAPGVDDRYYVLERAGRVKTFLLADAAAEEAVDFSSQVITDGEGGALSMAFHPDFANNPYAYIFFTASRQTYGVADTTVSMISVVRRYTVSADGRTFSNPTDVLAPTSPADDRFHHTFTNHKGGWIGFSPADGYLYVTMGDSGEGPGGAPISNDFDHPAQDLQSLHGKVLRIDVNSASPYAIPTDNPFAEAGGLPEIYAWGLRNPWRASFDRETGDLWVGDVGEGDREEINLVELGGNYGWPFREGNLDRCAGCVRGQESLAPVIDLPHSDGWVSVIGGYVYRGAAMPELQGRYIFSDWIRSGITTISYDSDGEPFVEDLIPGANGASTFSEDNAGNIWQVHMWGGFYRLTATTSPEPTEFPSTLSATGCFAAENIRDPAAGVVPFDVNSPLWSDGAGKERFFALPNDSAITVRDDGSWSFPVGSVLIKTFLLQNTPVETRLLVRHNDGDWAGYSYEWNEAGTDAVLLTSGELKAVGNQTWRFPSRAQCLSCHTAPNGDFAAERVLGLDTPQINRDFVYPGNVIANQIQTLAGIGYFAEDPGPHTGLPAMAQPADAEQPLADRAHAYLHTNCASCHQPGGPGRGGMDFRYGTSLSNGGYCNRSPSFGSFGFEDARLLNPGSAAESVIPIRMNRTDAHRMPPLGVDLVDDSGVTLIESWIDGMSACP